MHSWSANGHCVLSAATDGSVTLWSLDRKCVLHRFDTACPVLAAAVHPQNVHIALVSFAAQTDAHEPVLIDMRTGELCTLAFGTLVVASAEIVDERKPEHFTAAAIDASGARLVVGSSRFVFPVMFFVPERH
jgi:WD40 repeat protein